MDLNTMFMRNDYQNLEEQEEQFSTEIHSKITWDHIQNLDKFFSNVYYFHQQHGFFVTFIEFILQLLKFFFIIWVISVFSDLCFTDFNILENNSTINYKYFYNPIILRSKNIFTSILVIISLLILILFIINSIPKLHQFYSISKFYKDALKIKDDSIADKTWCEVLRGLTEVQRELQLCVHKPLLNELDIYHRILRRQNYLIAMMAKDIFPTEISLPFIGSCVIVTKYYLDSLKYMLFKCPYKSPFGDYWQLRAEYKDLAFRKQLISQITLIAYVIGFCQLLISPVCFMYLLVTKACTYGHSLKISPAQCVNREITPYGRIFLAHFNELPHEFAARVTQAYTPANEYLDSFISKTVVALARLVRFLAGGIIFIGFLVSMTESRFLLAPHIITVAAIVTFAYAISLKLIPDESLVVCPRLLIDEVLKHIHYVPDHWKDAAHTRKVYNEVAKLFQPKILSIVKELFSCFMSPLIFLFLIPKYAPKMVDFLRNYTTDMHGVGDICSFAHMDINKHGSTTWATSVQETAAVNSIRGDTLRHGKVELSLLNFHSNNPLCPLGNSSERFISDLKSHMNMAMPSLNHVGSFPPLYSTLNDSHHLKNASRHVGPMTSITNQALDNDGSALNNYFHNHGLSSMHLSHTSVMFDNYKSIYDAFRDFSRCDVNISIILLHGVHEQRRAMAHTIQPVNQIINEVEEDNCSLTTPSIDNNDLYSLPSP